LLIDQFFLKISKHSNFIQTQEINLFLFILSSLTEYFLQLTFFVEGFVITNLVKIFILKDLWYDKCTDSEIKNNFFSNAMIYREIKITVTLVFILDLIIKFFICLQNLKRFQHFLTLSKIVNDNNLFIFTKNLLYHVEIFNSSYSVLFILFIICNSMILYYITFYKKINIYERSSPRVDLKYNFLNMKDSFCDPVSTLMTLKQKNEHTLYIDEFISNEENRGSYIEKSKWMVKKSGINVPFAMIIFANEFQLTKQRLWYEIKNEKN
jgi:hypothetical protein